MSLNQVQITGDSRKVIRLICVTWFITKLICFKLWLADRLFPLIPVNDLLTALPSFVHNTCFVVSLASMLLLIFFPGKKIALVLLLAEIFSCLLDQNRWQPWEYQFTWMLAVYIFAKATSELHFLWQLILAGIYFFSGISKLNSAFIHDIWQNLMLRRWLHVNAIHSLVTYTGYLLPMIEMLAGIGLLLDKTRKLSVWILISMHVIILLMLGPIGLNINKVVWPWNLLMLLLLYLLFYKGSFQFRKLIFMKPAVWLLLLCWWVLPWLQLAGYWDKYLSSVLYAGGVEQLYICTSDPRATKDMAVYLDKEFKIIPCKPLISAYKWGVIEINTSPYPEPRIYNAIIRAWRKRYPNTTDKFYLYKPGFAPTVKEVLIQYPAYQQP